MRMRRSFMTLSAVVLLASGCAATSDYMRPAQPLGAAPQDMARIVFIRPSSFAKGVAVTIVDEKANYIGESTPSAHFAVLVPAGEHTFIAWGEGTHSLKANVAAGKTYYVEVSPNMGMWSARFHLKAIKPSTPKWQEMQGWMTETEPLEVAREGQAALVDSRRGDAEDAIRKGLARFAEYTSEEASERTLAPNDGV